MAYQTFSGSFSIQASVADWKAHNYTSPQLWLDLGAYRESLRRDTDQWYLAQGSAYLLSLSALQPLPSISIPAPQFPELTLPEITWPAVSVPNVSVPSFTVSLSVPAWSFSPDTSQRILKGATHLAYGISLASFLFFLGPILLLESQHIWKDIANRVGNSRIYSAVVETPALEGASPPPTTTTMPTPTPESYVSNSYDVFSLKVPELDIESIVIPNVDSADKESYTTALKQGIAHAAGTGLPDQLENNKTMYFFAHSTDAAWNVAFYNAQFYALKDAEIGQTIDIRFWGEDYSYRIVEKTVIAADDTSALAPQTEQEQLILQTCYPPGTTWKRLLIRAVPASEYDEYQEKQNTPEDTITSYNSAIDDIDKPLTAQYNTRTV